MTCLYIILLRKSRDVPYWQSLIMTRMKGARVKITNTKMKIVNFLIISDYLSVSYMFKFVPLSIRLSIDIHEEIQKPISIKSI